MTGPQLTAFAESEFNLRPAAFETVVKARVQHPKETSRGQSGSQDADRKTAPAAKLEASAATSTCGRGWNRWREAEPRPQYATLFARLFAASEAMR